MVVSQKCQYAIRAIFELAKRQGLGPIKIGLIAESQVIPPRFLENILNQLKRGGIVESRRGKDGGYFLARPAAELTVGEVIRFVQGPLHPVECCVETSEDRCPLMGRCVFQPLWDRARRALEDVYDGTTFHDLLEQEQRQAESQGLLYSI